MPLTIVVVLGLVGGFAAKPIYRALRLRKGRQAAETAAAHFATNGYADGVKALQIAAQFAPSDPAVLQLRAEFLTKFHDPRAIAEWYQLAAVRPLNLEQSWQLVDLALSIERLDVAGEELRKLKAVHGREPTFLARQIRYDLLTGNVSDAVDHARTLVEIEPGNPKFEILLGTALVRSANGPSVGEGKRILIILAQTEVALQVEAMSLLLDYGALTGSERGMLARVLNSRPDLDLNGQILSATLRLTTDKRQREDAAEEVRSLLPAKDEAAAIRFTDWCLQYQMPTAAIAAIGPYSKGTNQESINLHLQVVALSEDWGALDALLAGQNARFDPAVVEIVRGWHSARTGKTDEAIGHFKVAIAKAAATPTLPSRHSLVASWAERAGLPLVAVEAWSPLLQNSETTLFAARASLRLLLKHDELAPTLPILRSLLAYSPSDGSIQLEYARAALVLNQDVPKAAALAEELYRQFPKGPTTRLLAALGRTRNGQPAQGLTILEENPIDPTDLDDRWRALEVFVLAKAQQREPARRLARQIQLESLRAEERALIEVGL